MAGEQNPQSDILHASCVAYCGRAVLVTGAAGRGKSGLALQLLALGAGLVADDRTLVRRVGAQVLAAAPQTIRGQIEARGVGILRLPPMGPQPVSLVVDMDAESDERLPMRERVDILGLDVPVVKKCAHMHFPATILLYLKHGMLS
nr:serine kinase [uncultured Roseovarius sp.]